MPKRSYKPVQYKGQKIEFVTQTGGNVFARVPSITRQYLGYGKNKTQALDEAKKIIDSLSKSHNKYVNPDLRLYTRTTSRKRAHDIANLNGYYEHGVDYFVRRAGNRYEVYQDMPASTAQRLGDVLKPSKKGQKGIQKKPKGLRYV